MKSLIAARKQGPVNTSHVTREVIIFDTDYHHHPRPCHYYNIIINKKIAFRKFKY